MGGGSDAASRESARGRTAWAVPRVRLAGTISVSMCDACLGSWLARLQLDCWCRAVSGKVYRAIADTLTSGCRAWAPTGVNPAGLRSRGRKGGRVAAPRQMRTWACNQLLCRGIELGNANS